MQLPCLAFLRHSRSLVSDEVAHQIAFSIMGSRLDYCNSLLLNCSNRNLDKLQRVQNNLTRVVCNSSRLTPAELMLRSLHWLSVRQRIDCKLDNLCYLAISFHQPVYTLLIWSAHTVSRVRYDHQHKVFFPFHFCMYVCYVLINIHTHTHTHIDIAARRFSVAAPTTKTLELSTTELSDCSIRKHYADARYWYSKSVHLSVRNIPVSDENGLTYRHSFFFTIR